MQMFHICDRDLHYERIAAGSAMAFEYLGRSLHNLDDVAVIDAGDAHADERHYRQPDFCGVDIGTVAGDDVRIFELSDTLDDGRRGQSDAAAEFGIARSGIFLQFL